MITLYANLKWSLQFSIWNTTSLNIYSEFVFFHLHYYPVRFIQLKIVIEAENTWVMKTFLVFHVHLHFSDFEDNFWRILKTHWMHLRKHSCYFREFTRKTHAWQTNFFLWQHDRMCQLHEKANVICLISRKTIPSLPNDTFFFLLTALNVV